MLIFTQDVLKFGISTLITLTNLNVSTDFLN